MHSYTVCYFTAHVEGIMQAELNFEPQIDEVHYDLGDFLKFRNPCLLETAELPSLGSNIGEQEVYSLLEGLHHPEAEAAIWHIWQLLQNGHPWDTISDELELIYIRFDAVEGFAQCLFQVHC
jgi:hypothetical protein